MLNKIYAFLKENRKDLIIFAVLMILFSIKLPYYVESPGGTLSLKERLEIEESEELNGDISLVYVAERPGTIPALALSFLFKDWDIAKKEEVVMQNEDEKDVEIRGKINLNQSLNTAIVYAFQKANKEIDILSQKVYVTYVYEAADTDLKVGDQIIYVDDIKVDSRKDIANYLSTLEVSDEITIKVLIDKEEKIKKAKIVDIQGAKKIGILTDVIYEYKLSQEVKCKEGKSEMGSSGGFANTLYIYASLIDEDLIKGRKVIGTGTIDEDGNVGAIGGVKYKLSAAVKAKADVFFIPSYNCEEATNLKNKNKYDINLVCISTFDEAIDYLKK